MHEWIIVSGKPDFRLKNRGASGESDVWTIPPEQGNDHPAPFPVRLAETVLETTGAKTVLEPFNGSGTTLIAAMRAGVSATGIELDEKYCEMTARRCEREAGNSDSAISR